MLKRWIFLQQFFNRCESLSMRHREVRYLDAIWISQEFLFIYKMEIAAHGLVPVIG